jgi:hypothetical protein
MSFDAQLFEKNHFLAPQNQDILPRMSEQERQKSKFWMLMIAAALALAILAPVAVLAA